jgi:hypothetical protein
MYCPKCATQNGDDAKFCRSCGANLSLVPQALTGRLPDSRRQRRRDRHGNDRQAADLASGIQKVFTGLGFVLISIAVRFFAPAGSVWWFWLLIPAVLSLCKGVAEIVSARTAMSLPPATNQTTTPPARVTGELQQHPTYDTLPPPSVTEGTTRHLDPQRDSYKERL